MRRRAPALWCALVLCAGLAAGGQAGERQSGAPPRVVLPTPVAGLPGAPKAAAAPAPAPTAQNAVAQKVAAAAPVLEALSPDRAASISGEQASGLAAKLAGENVPASGSAEVFAAGAPEALRASLSRSGASAPEAAPSNEKVPTAGRLEAPASLRDRVSDRIHFTRLWAQNLWFYVVQNIVMKWKPYHGEWQALKASGIQPPVSSPRDFFAHMRVMGQTGDFYIMGFVAREDRQVIEEAAATFRKYFDSPQVGRRELKAFGGFVARALHYNEGKRSTTYFRKIIRDNMLKASVMSPDKIAPFFEGLYVQKSASSAADFQGRQAADILERFRAVMLEELAKEPEGVKGRVRAAILIGSFAYGAATPASDFDVELVTEGGSDARLPQFVKRLTDRWKAEGMHRQNPVTFHMFPFSPSRRLVRMVHDAPYLVMSPDAALAAELAMRDGEAPAFSMPREMGRMGSFKRGLQYAAVYLTSLLTR